MKWYILSTKAGDENKLKLAIEQLIAEKGMESTKDIIATKGRASYVGERSLGHIDPGAASSYLMIKVICETIK